MDADVATVVVTILRHEEVTDLLAVRHCERGFAMAALLIMLNVMAVAMTMLMPAWQTMATREREAELVFRGQQYARAVALYQRSRGAFPPSVDVLVTEKFLRKKYKDPMTENGEFQVIIVGAPIPGGMTPPVMPGRGGAGTPQGRGTGTGLGGGGLGGGGLGGGLGGRAGAGASQGLGAGGGAGPGMGSGTGSGFGAGTAPPTGAGLGGGTPAAASGFNRVTREASGGVTGPVLGVVSKSTGTSFRLFNGRNKYSEWAFVATEATTQAGAGGGTPTPGGRGTQAPGMGGRGQQAPGMGRARQWGDAECPQGSTAPPLQLPGLGRGGPRRSRALDELCRSPFCVLSSPFVFRFKVRF